MKKQYCIIRIQWGANLDTDIWSERFDTEEQALEFLSHYIGSEHEYIIVPVYGS